MKEALQFVPAFPNQPDGASWDVIIDDEKKDSREPMPTAAPPKVNSVASFQRRYSDAAQRSTVSSSGGRISRIKSLFSSRATIRCGEATHSPRTTLSTPPSPAHSNGSSAYVGWPGTQDSTGKTVPVSSYDDSSAGPAALLVNTRKAVQDDEMENAEQQISRWTANTSANTDDFSSVGSLPSPVRGSSPKPSRELNISDLSFEDDLPTSAAEFHLAAAVADANAALTARRRSSLSSIQLAHSDMARVDDGLRQAVPLTRTKVSTTPTGISLTNRSNRVRNRGRSPPGEQNISPNAVRFVPSRSVPLESSNPRIAAEGSVVTLSPASKTSSAYFNDQDIAAMHLDYPDFRSNGPVDLDDSPEGSPMDVEPVFAQHASTRVLRRPVSSAGTSQPPTEGALHANDHLSPPHRTFTTSTSKGYRGLLDKTKEVPSLMDNFDSDSMSSSKATSVASLTPSNSGGRNQKNRLRHDGQAARGIARNLEEDLETVSDVFDGVSVSKESDVFDNLSFGDLRPSPRKPSSVRQRASYPERIAEEDDNFNPDFGAASVVGAGDFKVVFLGGGLTAIQSTQDDVLNRRTASDFDGNLTNSDISSNGYVRIPGFLDMVSAGKDRDNTLRGINGNIGMRPRGSPPPTQSIDAHEDASSAGSSESSGSSKSSSHRSSLFSDPYQSEVGLKVDGDLSEYYVHPSLMKKVLRKYRILSDIHTSKMGFAEFEKEEDERKAFALFEMRSRVMEKDIERGLERRGGSFVVDDLVTTAYNRTAHRIRDAVIVSKAWRDGANISDVINSAVLTLRAEHSYFIKRPIRDEIARGNSATTQRNTWEAVRWVDDADFMHYRCPSLGSRHLRGFEMFTIGDCQSILLKMANERCMVSFDAYL